MQKLKPLILFVIGGMTYFMIEILWRGYSHLSMFVLGGLCFIFVGLINEWFEWEMPLYRQQVIATAMTTLLELIFGLILNLMLDLNVWDYSDLPFNFLGQICIQYSIAWFFLSALAIVLDDYLRYWLFDEERPHYKLF